MKGPWEVVIVGKGSGNVLFPTTFHWRKRTAEETAGFMRRVFDMGDLRHGDRRRDSQRHRQVFQLKGAEWKRWNM